jgi:hypothetical protein
MKITIIGTGYVGLVTGACLAEIGNDVFCLDVDPRKIEILNNGGMPIHEPGLLDIIARNRAAAAFLDRHRGEVAHGEIQFIAVGTPPDEDGSADLQYVLAAARNIGRHMTGFKVIVDKSTVPVGTAQRARSTTRSRPAARRQRAHRFSVVSNPEFLKEGAAVEDFMRPDRIVIGVDHDDGQRGAREDEEALRAVQPQSRAHDLHGRALGRVHQVRGQRDAGDAHLVHERDGESGRQGRRRHRSGAAASAPIRASAITSCMRARLRRLVLPEGRAGADPHGRRERPAAAHPGGRRGGQRRRRTC